MKSPAFQFYPADYLADANVQMMTLEEEGAYIRLLCYCWREGSLPNDVSQLARLVGKGCTVDVARVVQGWFVEMPNQPSRLVHPRLEAEREKQAIWSAKSSEGGKQSARKRREAAKERIKSSASKTKGGADLVSTKPQPTGQPNGNSSSTSTSTYLGSKDPKSARAEERPVCFPPKLDNPECRAAWDRWLEHKRKKRQAYKDADSQEAKLAEWKDDPIGFVAAIDSSRGNNYSGIFPPKANGSGQVTPLIVDGKLTRSPRKGAIDPETGHSETFLAGLAAIDRARQQDEEEARQIEGQRQ